MAYQKHNWVTREVIRREHLQNIEDGIYNEQERGEEAESTLDSKISGEISRAQSKEAELLVLINGVDSDITDEVNRATNKESDIEESLNAEITRAVEMETQLSGLITANSNAISTESSRAQNAESNLSSNISANTSSINAEVSRATQAESDLHDYVDQKVATTYKASGSIYFADLPALTESRQGNVYNIKDAFITTTDFAEGAGKSYPQGTNVAIVGIEEGGEIVYKYDVQAGFIDTSHLVSDTDYATSLNAGIVKPDGTTITVDADGMISSVGGGQGSAEAAERMIAPIEADNTSTRAYAVGQRLILNEVLYKAKIAIAIGDELVIGTNIELANALTDFDTTPTNGSTKFVTSGGVYSYIDTMITQAISASY